MASYIKTVKEIPEFNNLVQKIKGICGNITCTSKILDVTFNYSDEELKEVSKHGAIGWFGNDGLGSGIKSNLSEKCHFLKV